MISTGIAFANPRARVFAALARTVAPRKPTTVSQWAEAHMRLSSKGSVAPGRFRIERNPALQEPMDCMSARSIVRSVVCCFPIQFGKSTIESAVIGYSMNENPGPIMVCLPGEVSLDKFIAQKLNPLIEETPAVRECLSSVSSRDSQNTKTFKDFAGGQLYIEHAGNPKRLKSTSVKILLVDEFTEFATSLTTGDDPVALLEGRTSAFPAVSKAMYVSTPGIRGICRTTEKYEDSDQRLYHLPCPHCGHLHAYEWRADMHYSIDPISKRVSRAWLVCPECACLIEENHKPAMLAAGRWIPTNPGHPVRGYRTNCIYYPIGLGPRWLELAQMWVDAQGTPEKLKTFVNDRLAEAWEDLSMRAVKHNLIAERAEPYNLRIAPMGVCYITAGADTQDDRLEVHIIGWGRNMASWTLDYVVLPGDPAKPAVWQALTELLARPIEHACGAKLAISACAIDGRGHRTPFVKAYVLANADSAAPINRPMCIFGAKANNAPVLGRPKWEDINTQGKTEKRGIHTYTVGTVAAKHWLFRRMGADADLEREDRLVHFSDQLKDVDGFFPGMVSETYDPRSNRFIKKRGVRNEQLDCFDEETEVMTKDGWKPFRDIGFNDELATVNLPTDRIEYQRPEAIIAKPYAGEMVQIKGSRIDVLVTPRHRMVTLQKEPVTKPDGKRGWTFDVQPKITLAEDLTVHHTLKIRSTWQGLAFDEVTIPASVSEQGNVISPAVSVNAGDIAALLGWWVSEGSVQIHKNLTSKRTSRRVFISQRKPVNMVRIEALLAKLPWRWHYSGSSFVCTSKQLYDYVLQFGRLQDQRIVPQWVKESTPEIIERFIETAILGDGWKQQKQSHHRVSRAYATTSKRLADDFQELFIKIGQAATMRVVEPKPWCIEGRTGNKVKTQYHVYERKVSRASLDGGGAGKRGYIGQRVHYEGHVYCASVPNGTLIVRRGGKTFIAGNCFVYAYAAAHHPELHLHRFTRAEWASAEARIINSAPVQPQIAAVNAENQPNSAQPQQPTPAPKPRSRVSRSNYLR